MADSVFKTGRLLWLVFAAIAAIVLISSCVVEEPDLKEGDTYGVYFPNPNPEPFIIHSASDQVEFEFDVERLVASKGIEVECATNMTAEKREVLEIGSLIFPDKASVTKLKVKLKYDKAVEGTEYSLSISVDGAKYKTVDPDKKSEINLVFVRASKFDLGTDGNGNEIAVKDPSQASRVSWTMNRWGGNSTGIISYYTVGGARYCKTVSDNPSTGFWGNGREFEFVWYPAEEDCNGNQPIYFKPQPAMSHNGVDMNIYDWYSYMLKTNPSSVPDSFLEFAAIKDTEHPSSYYDGNGGFYFASAYYVPASGSGNAQVGGKEDMVGVAADFIRLDNSVTVTTGYVTIDGKVPVTITAGQDVTEIMYAVYEGRLTEELALKKSKEIISGVEVNAKQQTLSGATVLEISRMATGIYTIVAVSPQKSGTSYSFGYSSFGYVAAGENKPVVSVQAKLQPTQGREGSLTVSIVGEDIASAKIGIYTAADYNWSKKACEDNVKAKTPVSSADLAKINTNGFAVNITENIVPGMDYVLLVWVENIYGNNDLMEPSEATAGGTLPPEYGRLGYVEEDVVEELLTDDETDFYGSWNYFARDRQKGDVKRRFIGTVTIEDSEYPDDYDESIEEGSVYVTVKGLSGEYGEIMGFDDSITFDLYNRLGYLFMAEVNSVDGSALVYTTFAANDQNVYDGTYAMAFIPVADGYYALVENVFPAEGVQGYSGIKFYVDKGVDSESNFAAFEDILLVAKEAGSASLAAIDARVRAAKAAMTKVGYVSKRTVGETISMLNAAVAAARMIVEDFFVLDNATAVEFPSVSVEFDVL